MEIGITKKNICKNFTDAAALVGAVFAAFLVFVAYRTFKPSDDIAHFYDVTQTAVYLRAAIIFLISFVANVASRKSPFVGLAFSLVPIWYLLNCYSREVLTGRPAVYIVLAVAHLSGCIIYTVQWLLENKFPFARALICGISAFGIASVFFALRQLGIEKLEYGEPLVYLRGGIAFTSLFCALSGLIFVFRNEKKSRRKKIALATVLFGALSSLVALVFHLFFN